MLQLDLCKRKRQVKKAIALIMDIKSKIIKECSFRRVNFLSRQIQIYILLEATRAMARAHLFPIHTTHVKKIYAIGSCVLWKLRETNQIGRWPQGRHWGEVGRLMSSRASLLRLVGGASSMASAGLLGGIIWANLSIPSCKSFFDQLSSDIAPNLSENQWKLLENNPNQSIVKGINNYCVRFGFNISSSPVCNPNWINRVPDSYWARFGTPLGAL